ncbi:MAG: hypothetical protein AB7F19_02025 [Candidatus Babeliales bacterium]
MKKQLLIMLACVSGYTTGAYGMFQKFDAVRGTQGIRPASVSKFTSAPRPTVSPAATAATLPTGRLPAGRVQGAPERLPVQPSGARSVVTATPATTTIATPRQSRFSFAQSQEAFSSISTAPGASAALPEQGVSTVSEGMSSADTFRGLGQTTGSTAPAAAQNVMQSAPAQRARGFFNK